MQLLDTTTLQFSTDDDNDHTVGPRMGMRREPCAVCGMPVFLAEKLVISRTPYHRTCFRCARCSNQLTPGNYYETEDGQYCCETCPDEEEDKSSILHQAYNEAMIIGRESTLPLNSSQTDGYQGSLSDEEKTERRAKMTDEILGRVTQSSNLVNSPTIDTREEGSPISENHSQTAQMRLSFMTSHLLMDNKTEESSSSEEQECSFDADDAEERTRTKDSSSLSPRGNLSKRRDPEGSSIVRRIDDGRVDAVETTLESMDDRNTIGIDVDIGSRSVSKVARTERRPSDVLDDRLEDKDEGRRKYSFDTGTEEATHVNDHYSYVEDKKVSIRQDTKDKIGPDINVDASKREDSNEDSAELSLVQRRLKIFESTTKNDQVGTEKPIVESSFDVNLKKTSLVDSDDKEEDRNEIDEETSRIIIDSGKPQVSSEIETSVEEEKETREMVIDESIETPCKADNRLPPIVPKRMALESRRAERSATKKSEVTVLNASGIDLSGESNYPKDLNPFGSDEEEDCTYLDISRSSKVSSNPFGSSDEEEEETKIVVPPRPATRNISNASEKKDHRENVEDIDEAPGKRRLKAPQINFNPFWSDDDEDHESEDEQQSRSFNTPVPKPRTITQNTGSLLSPWKNELSRGEIYASNSSLASTGSTSTPGGTYRKKKPAPPPPIAKELFASSEDSRQSPNNRPNAYAGINDSLRSTPRARKAKPAPPPPMPTSTPCTIDLMENLTLGESPIMDRGKLIDRHDYEMWNDPKNGKDEANRNKQSMTTICNDTSPYDAYTDKSVQGKWKRKKGPAPARPIPHRRKIKVMSLKDVKLELDEIEMQQQGLERQGVRLEQLIRDKAEAGNATEETSLGMDVEELVLELFALVNEKNELFRRQAELMLLRRQQRLEEEHADIEYQIRCLLCQPEATKTDFDKQREESLIQRLVEIVERRNEIVECLEMDRRREVEEDRSINTQMGIYAAKNKADFAKEAEDDENNRPRKTKKAKLKEKAREKILRKSHKKDADKDVDETEVKLKRQNKRKWF